MRYVKIFALLASAILAATACNTAGSSSASSSPANPATGTTTAGSTEAVLTSPAGTETGTQDTSTPSPTSLVLYPPVENNPPNAPAYEPAFEGQTRAPGLRTVSPYTVEVLTDRLASPWAVTALPDGRLLITEKAGSLRIWSQDHGLSARIGGFPELDSRGQGGLLDVAPAPDFAQSRELYFTFAEQTAQGSATAVGFGRLAADERKIENFTTIYRALPYYDNSMHFGSRLTFAEDGTLFVSTGERSDLATRALAQTLDNGYGKILHITADGEPVPGGPFAGQSPAWPEIYSYGHRNVQGLALHPATGRLWISEMGPRGGDELNLIVPGGNYGWGEISYGLEYSGAAIGGGETQLEGTEQPVYYWDPVLAPSGMAFYEGDAIPEWRDNLFIGGLRAQHISRLVLDGQRVVGEERLLEDEGQRFRDVGMGRDGALYAVTDGGRLYRIGP